MRDTRVRRTDKRFSGGRKTFATGLEVILFTPRASPRLIVMAMCVIGRRPEVLSGVYGRSRGGGWGPYVSPEENVVGTKYREENVWIN